MKNYIEELGIQLETADHKGQKAILDELAIERRACLRII